MARFDPDSAIPLKETAADKAVKERLWEASKAELLRFAGLYAQRHEPGVRYSDGQRDATAAAKAKGYRIGLVRLCGQNLISGNDKIRQEMDEAIARFRVQLGL